MMRVRWLGQLWYRMCMIWTAVSVLPVPGGPTTRVSPGCTPDRMADACTGVNRTVFWGGTSCG
jgi:hypothetical protein